MEAWVGSVHTRYGMVRKDPQRSKLRGAFKVQIWRSHPAMPVNGTSNTLILPYACTELCTLYINAGMPLSQPPELL